jgi:methionine synthase I (cobalamin-dependent)
MSHSINKLQAAVNKALESAQVYGEAIALAVKAAEGMPRDAVRVAIMPTIGAFYKVPLVDGSGKAEGTKVFDKEAKAYEAARKALQRLLKDIMGVETSSPSREAVIAPRKVFKSVLSEILNSGMSKAEFNALLTELRDSVSFE